jgi:hypothetical protein
VSRAWRRRRLPRARPLLGCDGGMVRLVAELLVEVSTQDFEHQGGYPATRDGVRLGLAAAEDELVEAHDAWRDERRVAGWRATRGELLQVAAVALRVARSIGAAERGSEEAVLPAVIAGGDHLDGPFWNLTEGRRPGEPVPGLFNSICAVEGRHVHDSVYGPDECARCGAPTTAR